MNKKALISISIMMAGGVWIGATADNEVYAISGCCKQRISDSEPWYRSGSDFDACKILNLEVDENDDEIKDIIFDESGKVWWDMAC